MSGDGDGVPRHDERADPAAAARRLGAALEGAKAFVESSREPVSVAYLAALAGNPGELREMAARCTEPSGALGSLLPGAPEGPGVASTVDALNGLFAAGIRDGSLVENAAGFLQRAQDESGAWVDPVVREPLAALSLSGHACGVLGQTPFARQSTLDRGVEYLAHAWSVDRVQEGRLDVIAAYLHALSACPSELADEALQWCGRELERGWRIGRFAPASVARVFLLCDAMALPAAKVSASDIVEALLDTQAQDGSWEGGLRSTLEAAAALARHDSKG
ncbi:MAG: hypothetical protein OEP95_13820 [Myxococcales bacterium]|nr:hypothetical protein [Myxococcales bacterium]